MSLIKISISAKDLHALILFLLYCQVFFVIKDLARLSVKDLPNHHLPKFFHHMQANKGSLLVVSSLREYCLSSQY